MVDTPVKDTLHLLYGNDATACCVPSCCPDGRFGEKLTSPYGTFYMRRYIHTQIFHRTRDSLEFHHDYNRARVRPRVREVCKLSASSILNMHFGSNSCLDEHLTIPSITFTDSVLSPVID